MATSSAPVKRGAFIVFEGIDRADKSTNAHLLADSMRANGISVAEWSFPEYKVSKTGQLLRQYLDSGVKLDARTQHLLFAANRAEWVGNIDSILKQGTTIICDRYVYSGIAYSAAKGLDFDWCCMVEDGLPMPDLVIHLQVDPKVAATRSKFGKELHDDVAFLGRVQEQYTRLCEHKNAGSWVVINAGKALDDIHLDIQSAIDCIRLEALPPLSRIQCSN